MRHIELLAALALAGTGGDATPLRFSENNSRTDRPIVTKLSKPIPWTILHLSWKN